jgi:ABC-2 type transport system ATP-binding protein
MNEALRIHQLSFSIGRKKILNQLDIALAKGRALGLVGHNGAGKTTLFHLLLALKFPSAGKIFIFGESNLCHSIRRRLGYVSERPYLNLEDSFDQALTFAGKCCAVSSATLNTRIGEIAQQVGLEKNRSQKLKNFSKGMLQRTLIAQALIGDPDFLILDEPMSGLDPEGRAFIRDLIQSWKQAGKTILFSSHALEDIELLADEVMVLDGGQQKFYGDLAEWKKLGDATSRGGSLA